MTKRIAIIALGASAVLGAIVCAPWLAKAGIPTVEPMYYAGMLKAAGNPIDGKSLNIEVSFWKSESETDAGTFRVCHTSKKTTPIAGRFRIPLADGCTSAVQANSDLWVEVAVNGTTLKPRRKLGAVPYAIEALNPGPKGDKGDPGPTGDKGDKGDPGPAGDKGDKGDPGPKGEKGDKGDTGAAGAVGPKGDTGAAGAVGPKGDTGAAGAVGPKGDTGAAGAVGPKGDTGATGATGARGATGATGPQGPPGPNTTIGRSNCLWTNYVNSWDGQFTYVCPNSGFIAGISSYHDNTREDRRFRFYCCRPYNQ